MKRVRSVIKRFAKPFFLLWYKVYLRKLRTYSYKGITVSIHPEVFPPVLTFSTKILLDFIDTLELKGKSFLELGCGCGIISLYADKKGANVTASDINLIALENLELAAERHHSIIKCVASNLFDKLEDQYDIIIINPPYYPQEPKSVKDRAWYCGVDFQYFEQLFLQLSSRVNSSEVYMILSEDCDLKRIESIAEQNRLQMEPFKELRNQIEENTIFKIQAS